MLKALAPGLLLILLLLIPASANDSGFSRCNCEDEGSLWIIESILESQRVSDFLIAVAYFSIPIELLYFVSCSNVPFKWVLFEFIAFIVLCGMTHLINVKVREFMLKKKAWDLGREVGIIMKQKEAGLHVRMLTQEIRKSLDRHTILYTTLVELSKTLGLQNCAVWMPNDIKTQMDLTHELNRGNYLSSDNPSIPITDPDVDRIKRSEAVNILRPDSALAAASHGGSGEPGTCGCNSNANASCSQFQREGLLRLFRLAMRYWYWFSLVDNPDHGPARK
ncbi:hypothetical protein OIU78_007299 [Salix suchowensis]|nr:hypothetical protein OIU78_007299 [Salix suchowensis]